jgi:hypothetical protein
MIKNEIAPGIMLYLNVLENPQEVLEELEAAVSLNVLDWSKSTVKHAEEVQTNANVRDTDTIGVDYFGRIMPEGDTPQQALIYGLNNILYSSFDPIEKDYFQNYGINCESHDSYGILKYGKGQHFTNHIDDDKDYHRRVSTVYYFNEDYLGGEIEFPRFNLKIKPGANQMIVFPSTYTYNHSVHPVTEGTRYAVVSWMK